MLLTLRPGPEERLTGMAGAFGWASNAYLISPELLISIAWAESSLRPMAVNKKTGAAGLMGIARVHHPRNRSIFNVKLNVALGAEILRRYLDKCGNLHGALSMYDGRGHCRHSVYSRGVVAMMGRLRSISGRCIQLPWPGCAH